MEIHGVPCTVAALSEEERIVEIRLESDQEKSILEIGRASCRERV